jgi:hypothetical protein
MGRERIENDVPRLVLLELLGRTLIVVRNSLLNALGPYADTIRSNLVYRLLLDWPLRLFALLTAQLRRSPTSENDMLLAAVLYAVLSGLVLGLWGEAVIFPKKELSVMGVVLFVVAPLVMLSVVFSTITRRSRRGLFRFTRAAAILLALLAAASGMTLLVGLFFQPNDVCAIDLCQADSGAPHRWLLGKLCQVCGDLSLGFKASWVPKAAAVSLPLLSGMLLHSRLSAPRLLEDELRHRLARLSSPALEQLARDLRGPDWEPRWYERLPGGQRRVLVRWARTHRRVDRLRQLLRSKA